jgi:hypothetical protein
MYLETLASATMGQGWSLPVPAGCPLPPFSLLALHCGLALPCLLLVLPVASHAATGMQNTIMTPFLPTVAYMDIKKGISDQTRENVTNALAN